MKDLKNMAVLSFLANIAMAVSLVIIFKYILTDVGGPKKTAVCLQLEEVPLFLRHSDIRL
uniref:Uncharacterized protein n=1 Tax=Anguilla anguilla TaxID=7936 RepID=A0A0E9T7Q3_ANGAN